MSTHDLYSIRKLSTHFVLYSIQQVSAHFVLYSVQQVSTYFILCSVQQVSTYFSQIHEPPPNFGYQKSDRKQVPYCGPQLWGHLRTSQSSVAFCSVRVQHSQIRNFCSHSVVMCFVWISEQTAIISLYNINSLVCITETECVYCAVRTDSLYVIQVTCFVWISEQTRLISQYSINWLVCITETECVYCAVRTESLYVIQVTCFVWISEQTTLISVYNINWMVCITDGVFTARYGLEF